MSDITDCLVKTEVGVDWSEGNGRDFISVEILSRVQLVKRFDWKTNVTSRQEVTSEHDTRS